MTLPEALQRYDAVIFSSDADWFIAKNPGSICKPYLCRDKATQMVIDPVSPEDVPIHLAIKPTWEEYIPSLLIEISILLDKMWDCGSDEDDDHPVDESITCELQKIATQIKKKLKDRLPPNLQ